MISLSGPSLFHFRISPLNRHWNPPVPIGQTTFYRSRFEFFLSPRYHSIYRKITTCFYEFWRSCRVPSPIDQSGPISMIFGQVIKNPTRKNLLNALVVVHAFEENQRSLLRMDSGSFARRKLSINSIALRFHPYYMSQQIGKVFERTEAPGTSPFCLNSNLSS